MPKEMRDKYKDAAKVGVVVQAKDGRWSYGTNEEKLALKPKGDFDTPEAAREEAAKEFDIILNTASVIRKGPPPKKMTIPQRVARAQADYAAIVGRDVPAPKVKIPLRGSKA